MVQRVKDIRSFRLAEHLGQTQGVVLWGCLRGLLRWVYVVLSCGLIGFWSPTAFAEDDDPAEQEAPPPPLMPKWVFTLKTMPAWRTLDEGLELGEFPGITAYGQTFQMIVLRIDPRLYVFSVYSVTQEGSALSLKEWARRYNLTAAINASMYLPDGQTSTGYLRSGEYINNGRIVSRFGAFFVCGPDSAELPEAALLDRTEEAWEPVLARYRAVVQNYRLISAGRRLLWPPGGPRHSIAAVGRDGMERILFILCREPFTGEEFGTLLLALPIDVRLVMYTEGGSQAGLLVQTALYSHTWMGRHPADFWALGNTNAPLPNVIGIRSRKEMATEDHK